MILKKPVSNRIVLKINYFSLSYIHILGGYWHFILNYTESETVLDIPHSILLFLMSQDTYLGISFGTWLTYVEPLVFEMDLKSEKEASCSKIFEIQCLSRPIHI